MMAGKVGVKTVLVLVVLLAVGVLGVLGMNTARTYFAGAAADMQPQQVMSKVDEGGKSATISWTTVKESKGFVEYGTTPASLLLRSEVDSASAALSHSVTIGSLKPDVNYYYRLRVGDDGKDKNEWEVFDNGGIPYSFNTKVGVVPPTIALVSTVPQATPTVVGGEGCVAGVDYNNDGVINSIDVIICRTASPTASPTTTGGCLATVDYDGNGTINSFDRIKCLQDGGQ